jgi:hypothetical protein
MMCAIEGTLIRCSGHCRSGVCQRIVEHYRRFDHFVRPITRYEYHPACNSLYDSHMSYQTGYRIGGSQRHAKSVICEHVRLDCQSFGELQAFPMCLTVKTIIPPSWKQCLVANMRRMRPSLLGSNPDCFASSSIGNPSGLPTSLSVILALVTTWSATGSSNCVRNFSFKGYISDKFRSRDNTHTV